MLPPTEELLCIAFRDPATLFAGFFDPDQHAINCATAVLKPCLALSCEAGRDILLLRMVSGVLEGELVARVNSIYDTPDACEDFRV